MSRSPIDRRGRPKGGFAWKVLLVAAVAGYYWTRRGAPPASPRVVQRPVREALAKYDWPRAAPAGAKTELAANLTTANYYVVLDGSGSMTEEGCSGGDSKMNAAKRALAEFAKAVPPGAQLGLLAFDGRGLAERVPLAAGNRELFVQEVQNVMAAGGTPLLSAVSMGIDKLEEQARRQLGYGEYNLVVVTDGEASRGEDPRPAVDTILARSPVAIHTIGFCVGQDHSLNQPGRTLYKTAQSPEELRAGLGQVLAESETFDVKAFAPGGR
ncbi:MAG: VWA domain-containing protein [Elusimicrobia bacterium]|nr:VWA domain-containing protein [Elusimicrobiota bacterium]